MSSAWAGQAQQSSSTPGTSSTSATTTPNPAAQSAWLGGQNYDPTVFYTRATNTHDHAERIGFKIRPDLYSVIKALVASKEIPEYRDDSDFYRDAAVHRLQWIRENQATPELAVKIQASLDMLEFEEKLARWEHERRDLKQNEERFVTLIGDYIAEQDWEPLAHILDEAEEWVDCKREPIRSNFLARCKEARERLPVDYQNRS